MLSTYLFDLFFYEEISIKFLMLKRDKEKLQIRILNILSSIYKTCFHNWLTCKITPDFKKKYVIVRKIYPK